MSSSVFHATKAAGIGLSKMGTPAEAKAITPKLLFINMFFLQLLAPKDFDREI